MLTFVPTETKNLIFRVAWTCCDMKGLEHTDHFCKLTGERDLFEVTTSIRETHVLKKKKNILVF